MRKRGLPLGMAGIGLSVCLVASLVGMSAFQQNPAEAVRVDNDDLGGVVNGPRGPEAGVWVIAETTDLPTKFAKIVVTDDRGRYVVPDLPKANYSVWVRGYGLVDSPKVQAAPGKILNLTAVVAPTARAAAEYYPASYWYSLAKVPDKSEFPGTGANGNGISDKMKSQADWLDQMRCGACHQIGTKATREIPKSLGTFHSSAGSLGTTREVGTDGPRHGRQSPGVRPARDGHVRGLDRSHRGGRSARSAAPAAGRGTKRGRDLVGLVQRPGLRPRHDFDRQAQSDPQRQRSRLQHFEVQPARCQHPRPGAPYGNGCGGADSRHGHGLHQPAEEPGAVALLGRRHHLVGPGQPAQPDDGCRRTGLAHACDSWDRQSGLVQSGIEPSLRPAVPSHHERPPSLRARSENQAGDDDRHLLRHASPAVCRGRQQHALFQWERPGDWLVQHEAVRRDEG